MRAAEPGAALATAPIALLGYSGHSWVVADCLLATGQILTAYCERQPAAANPYGLAYLGFEGHPDVRKALHAFRWFVALGDNALRQRVQQQLTAALGTAPVVAAHPSAIISPYATVGAGTLLAPRAVLNAGARVGEGALINTGAIVEHECWIGDFVHLAPGAVLAGNVTIGAGAFVGAGAVVRQGIRIGAGALVGAGAVVVHEVSPGARVWGNPAKAR